MKVYAYVVHVLDNITDIEMILGAETLKDQYSDYKDAICLASNMAKRIPINFFTELLCFSVITRLLATRKMADALFHHRPAVTDFRGSM